MLKRTDMPAWKALQAHASHVAPHHLRDLFQEGGETRFDQLSVSALDMLFDFSRQRVTPESLVLLLRLARACDLEARIAALFAGEPVNNTEQRAAMHMALRNRSERPMLAQGHDVMPEVRAQLAKMREFVTGVHEGRITGFTGAPLHGRRQHRHRRLGSRHRDGDRSAGALSATRGSGCTACRTSTASNSRIRWSRSIPAPRCSSSARRRSRRTRRCANANAAREWLARRARRSGRRAAFRRRVDEPRGDGRASASRPTRASRCGTGSADAIRCGRRSACRSRSRSAWTSSS